MVRQKDMDGPCRREARVHPGRGEQKRGLFHVKQTPSCKSLLIVLAWSQDLHDPVQVLNACKLNADPSFTHSQRNLDVCIQAI